MPTTPLWISTYSGTAAGKILRYWGTSRTERSGRTLPLLSKWQRPFAAGEEIVVYIWDPAAIFVRTIKYQKFAGTGPGVSIFNLDPFNFLVDPDNTVIDCEYYRDGKWLVQSLLGTFVDGTVRKNSSSQVELSTPLLTGQELVVVRRVPVGSGSGGGGSPTDLENITVDLGFMTPHSVGTITKPASALYLKDAVTYDIWQLTVTSGNLQIIKVN